MNGAPTQVELGRVTVVHLVRFDERDGVERCAIDTVEIARIERLLAETPAADLTKLFSAQELADAGDALPAARCAVWIGHNMLFRGQAARARGWFGRAQRLLDQGEQDCVEARLSPDPDLVGAAGQG